MPCFRPKRTTAPFLASRGVDVLALTDHDEVAGLAARQPMGSRDDAFHAGLPITAS